MSEVDAIGVQQGFIAHEAVGQELFALEFLPPFGRIGRAEDALLIVTDTGIARELLVAPDFPHRAANAGEGMLRR